MEEINIYKKWVLIIREDKSSGEWLNLKIQYKGNEKLIKNNFYIGWNGNRLAQNKDATILDKYYKELKNSVITFLNRYRFS